MGLFDGCLLACDIDGTLIVNEYISQRNIDKIKYFVNEGGHFCLATGRTAGAISHATSQLDCISPSIVANGSMIYDIKNDKAIYEVFVPQSDYHIVKAVIDGCKTVGVEAHTGKSVILLNESQETIDHEKYENIDAISLDYEAALQYNWNKVLYLFTDLDEAKKVKDIIAKFSHDSEFVDTSAMINDKRRYYYEQVPKNVSKSTTLKILCDKLNITPGCCFAIGDYYNDVRMIKAADIGATLIDSPDEVKNAADVVVGTAQNGAVADFIDYLTERMLNNGCN